MDSIKMTTEPQLLKGWKKYRVSDIGISMTGNTPSTKKEENYGKHLPFIKPPELSNSRISTSETYLSTEGAKVARILPENSILISCIGNLGKVGINIKPVAFNQQINAIIPNKIVNPLFLFYQAQSIFFKNQLEEKSSATTISIVNKTSFESIYVYIPPLDTQQAIVNKIESLFDEIDEGIGRLKTAAQQIQQYRQSLLKNAFNGELTKEWRSKHADALPSENELLAQIQTAREQHHAQQLADWQTAVSQWEQNGKEGKKPSKPKAPTQAVKFEENFADLPKGWGTIKINQVAEIFTGATPLKSNANYYENGSIPWVTSGSLNNEFVDSADSFVTDLALKETNLKLLPKHTLLVAMYGEGKTRGKCSELLIEATTNQAIAGIVLNDRYPISRKFLKFYMFKNYADIRRQSSGGVQPNLNLGLVGNIIFPLPCLAEQTQIVAILESKLTACDQLADELAKQLKQAELLKQAVLKAAFSGNLLDK